MTDTMMDAFSYTPPTPSFPTSSSYIPRTPGQRTYAIGDVHGDLTKLVMALVKAGLVEQKVREGEDKENATLSDFVWSGGDSILVQVGDILDRGSYECACIHLLSALSHQASKSGGGIVLCLGNHEVLNALGLFNYAESEGNEEFERIFGGYFDHVDEGGEWRLKYAGNQATRWRCWEPGGALTTFNLLNNFVLSTQVGRSVFVHGGLTKEHLTKYGGIQGMNDKARSWFEDCKPTEEVVLTADTPPEDIINAARGRAKDISSSMPSFLGGGPTERASPVWMRDYSKPNDVTPSNSSALALAEEALEEIGREARRFVVGHTPQTRINSALDGKVWRIDVGMSKGVMNNMPEVIEITHGAEEDIIKIVRPGNEEKINGEDRSCKKGGTPVMI